MKVYHLTDDARKNGSWVRADVRKFADFEKNFELVANIDHENLAHAFELTNTIEDYWWNNDGVTKGPKSGYRSTSVGDIVGLEDGTFHMVDGSGYVDVTGKDISRLNVNHLMRIAELKIWNINR